jgi:predicted  nucleic acid-binding Zn-ribbon protein
MDQAEVLQIDYNSLSKEQDQERRQIKQLNQELAQVKAHGSILTQQLQTAQTKHLAAQKRLQDLRQALVQEHNNSKSRDMMPDQYWAIIEQFVPKRSSVLDCRPRTTVLLK